MNSTKEKLDEILVFDLIPEGSFYSELNESQVRALQLIEKIGDRLVDVHPEIADLYKRGEDFQTYIQVALQYVPEAEQFPQVASRAVGYAIRKLIPPEELSEIRRTRSAKQLEDMFDGFDSEQFREHCRKAAKRRHELGIGVDTEAMVRGRGRTPWTDEEKQYALVLSNNPAYQHQSGQQEGRPDYALIALELNIMFHDCSEVRYANSVASFIKDVKRKKKE